MKINYTAHILIIVRQYDQGINSSD